MAQRFLKKQRAAIAALVAFSLVTLSAAFGDPPFKHATLIIETARGPARLDVEVADTDSTREQGLMFRRQIAPGRGMIFLFDEARDISMWMKNTYISLDMVFIGDDWKIVRIERNTEPLSTAIIPSIQPASRVLEIGSGEADRLGLKVGDRVRLTE